MKKALCLLMFVTMFSAQAASVVCRGTSPATGQPFAVEITKKEVIVTGGSLSAPRIFKNLSVVNGLTTAPGLAVAYSNHFFGCVREVTIITELTDQINAGYMETLNVSVCSGGTTPDEVCGVD